MVRTTHQYIITIKAIDKRAVFRRVNEQCETRIVYISYIYVGPQVVRCTSPSYSQSQLTYLYIYRYTTKTTTILINIFSIFIIYTQNHSHHRFSPLSDMYWCNLFDAVEQCRRRTLASSQLYIALQQTHTGSIYTTHCANVFSNWLTCYGYVCLLASYSEAPCTRSYTWPNNNNNNNKRQSV